MSYSQTSRLTLDDPAGKPHPFFPKLFESGRIGTLRLKNRVIKAPMFTGLGNMDGTVSERMIRYYRSQAAGGIAMLIVEYAYIDEIASKATHCQLGISKTEHIPGLSWLADTIREAGAIPVLQVVHGGRQKLLGTPPIKAASAVPWPALVARYGSHAIPEELTIPEIEQIVEAFGDACVRAMMAGFDLVEIHGAHGYLITNFLSPHTNKRSDIYGGSLENRMRLLVQIVDNARSKLGPTFPLMVRLSGTDYEPDGLGVDETIAVAKVLEARGIVAIHISGGDHHQMIHESSPMAIPRGNNVWAAAAIKKEVRIPVIASGALTTPDFAEEVLAGGKGDFVALGRPLWADPQWVNKADAGRVQTIRPCIRCNDGCFERSLFKCRPVLCTVNPTVGREGELEIIPARKKKKVAVVGGGPAGLEAARVCALRGHAVTLYEGGQLGGMLNEGSVPDFKSDIRFLRDHLIAEQKHAGVRLVRQIATAETLIAAEYDTAVIATGAKPKKPDVPGINKPFVFDAVDVLNGSVTAKGDIIVIGGGLVGTETALYLAEQGCAVTVVHKYDELMRNCCVMDQVAYGERMARMAIPVLGTHRLTEVGDHRVTVVDKFGEPKSLPADFVFLAIGYSAAPNLAEALARKMEEVYAIGDCATPGLIYDAIHAGYGVGLKI